MLQRIAVILRFDPSVHLTSAFIAIMLATAAPGILEAGAQPAPQKLAIYGDSLATGVFFGMRDVFTKTAGTRVIRRSMGGTGLVRNDHFDWVAHADRFVRRDRPDVVVVSLGGNDRQDFVLRGRRIRRFTDAWWVEYMRRAEQVMRSLKRVSPKVYWLGIPVVRSTRMTQDYAKLNAQLRRLCRMHGIVYVDIWDRFRGADRRFTAFETVSGRTLRVRNRDGMHFTRHGNRRLAQIITGAIGGRVHLIRRMPQSASVTAGRRTGSAPSR